MASDDLISALFVIAPGFVALKLFQVTGTRWKRTDWEWVIWSLVAGVFIAVVVAVVIALVGGALIPPGQLSLTPEVVITTTGVPERFLVAVILGVGLGWVWQRLPWANAWRRRMENSAWDLVLQSTSDARGGVEVVTKEAETVERFYGALHSFGRESEQAEPWIYLTKVQRFDAATGQFGAIARTQGLLIHRDNVLRVRLVAVEAPQQPARGTNAAAARTGMVTRIKEALRIARGQ